MQTHFPLSQPIATRLPLGLAIAAILALALVAAASLMAQVSGDRGIQPVASSTDIEVMGIEVDVRGSSPQDARAKGWHEAQKLAWAKINGPAIPDSRLDSLVAAIIVEEEQLGARRYIARLGVVFDRQRAGALLGSGGAAARSAPMLLLPVVESGGSFTMFETRNDWQRAWAEYQFGSSRIDYVRPSGAGGESLLLTYGQTGRRSRIWWNTVLDQFSAADVLVPVARLKWQYPGGPVEGQFTARYGPDNRVLESFAMRVASPAQIPVMFEKAVQRFDAIFVRALSEGTLRPDPTLALGNLEISPQIRALLEQARLAEAAANAAAAGAAVDATPDGAEQPALTLPPAVATITVQVATPDPQAFDGALGAMRGVPGVGGVTVTSTAIGGTSVLRISFSGDLAGLATALRARGWQVVEGNGALAISR